MTQMHINKERQKAPAAPSHVPRQSSVLNEMSAAYEKAKTTARPRELDAEMKSRLEQRFGPHVSNIRIYETPGLKKLGEEGVAQGDEIHLAPGTLNSGSGEALLSHEMSHIAQQSRGMASGTGLNIDSALEPGADGGGLSIAASGPISATAAPMQGKRARGFFEKIGHKFKTATNWGGYRDLKEKSRQEAQNAFDSIGPAGEDDGGLDSVTHDSRLLNTRSLLAQRGDISSEHAVEKMDDLMPADLVGDDTQHYRALLGQMNGDLTQYTGIKQMPADTPERKQAKNRSCIKQLRSMELKLYEYQSNNPEAANDPKFLKMMDRIQKEHQDQVQIMMDNNFEFYSGNDDLTEEQQNIAKDTWNKIVANGDDAKSGVVVSGKHYNGTLNTPDKMENVEGFRSHGMAMMHRILGTGTGIDLLQELANSDKKTVVRPAQINNSGVERSPGAQSLELTKNSSLSPSMSNTGTSYATGEGIDSQINVSSDPKNMLDSAMKYNRLTDEDTTRAKDDSGHFTNTGKGVLSPQYVILAHEMMHVLHNQHGMNLRNENMISDKTQNAIWDNMEEQATVTGDINDSLTKTVNQMAVGDQPARTGKIGGDFKASSLFRDKIQKINENKMRRQLGLIERNSH